MKRNINLLISIYILCTCTCCSSKKIENNLIYLRNRTINIGNKTYNLPEDSNFAYDEIQNKEWICTILMNKAEFYRVEGIKKTKEYVIEFSKDVHPVSGWFGLYVYNNVALIPDDKNRFIIIDIQNKKNQIVESLFPRNVLIKGFSDKYIFATDTVQFYCFDYKKDKIVIGDYGMKNFEFMPLCNCIAGTDKNGTLIFYDLNDGKKKKINRKIVKMNNANSLRSRCYLSNKYIYYTKINNKYYYKNIILYFLGSLSGIGKPKIPCEWYRMNLKNNEIEKIDVKYPFINVLGVIED